MRNIRQSLFVAFVSNVAGVPIAAGILDTSGPEVHPKGSRSNREVYSDRELETAGRRRCVGARHLASGVGNTVRADVRSRGSGGFSSSRF